MQVNLGKISPDKLFNLIPEEVQDLCFLKSNSEEGFDSFVSFEAVDKFEYKIDFENLNWKQELNKNIDKHSSFVNKNTNNHHKIVGAFSYDFGATVEGVAPTNKDTQQTPDVYFLAFENWCSWNTTGELIVNYKNLKFLKKIEKILLNTTKKQQANTAPTFTPGVTKEEYSKSFANIKKQIEEGNLYQINLTYQNRVGTSQNGKEIFESMDQKHKVNYLCYLKAKEFEIISASPENFVKIRNKKIKTQPIKGTIKRGLNNSEDIINTTKLLNDKKEIAELDMITDLLRNDIGKVSKLGSIELINKRQTLKTPSVIHTFSTIEGELNNPEGKLESLIRLLPAGSIIGCPKHEAIKIINKVENERRGFYTGIIGIIEPNMDMDFAVIIRTIIKKGGDLNLGVGGGIVFDSDVDKEWQETLNKSKIF